MDRDAVAAVAALDEDVRRALYEHVCAAAEPVTREDAAHAVGISRKLAAFHLDKLVEHGLLRSGFGAPQTRRVGRAPRVYRPSEGDLVVRLPDRQPELLAAILIDALRDARPGESTRAAAERAAHEHGRALGGQERARLRPGRVGAERAAALVRKLLAGAGFAPYVDGEVTRLRNCPFHPLAARAPELVCAVNHAYLRGVLAGLQVNSALQAELVPRAGGCCVELHAPGRRSGGVTAAS